MSGARALLQAENEQERNEWMAHINYASAYRTAGMRMKDIAAPCDPNSPEQGRRLNSIYLSSWREQSRERATPSPISPSSPLRRANTLGGQMQKGSVDELGVVKNDQERGRGQSEILRPRTAGGQSRIRSVTTSFWPRVSVIPADAETLVDEKYPLTVVTDSDTLLRSRSKVLKSKIAEMKSKAEALEKEVNADSRHLRLFSILTPFQRSTRTRIQAAVNNLSMKVMQVRLELVKAKCYIDVLSADLETEDSEYSRSEASGSDALQSGLDSDVDAQLPSYETSMASDAPPEHPIGNSNHVIHFPRNTESPMPISISDNSDTDTPPSSNPTFDSPEPTTTSALFPQNAASDDALSISGSSLRDLVGAPAVRYMTMPPASPEPDTEPPAELTSSRMSNAVDEEAEEWNCTRAAKRVSLVQLPARLHPSNKYLH